MESKPLSGFPLILAAIAVSLATFLIVIDYSIANVSIPYISGDLAAGLNEGTYVITSFAVGSAIALPMCGWLTKQLGIVRLMMLALFGFTSFSVICGLSPSLSMLVVARFLQGVAAGPLVPISQTLMVRLFPNEQKSALALWSTVTITAPIFGPILGGWICYNYDWPWIFYLNLPIGLFCLFTIGTLLSSYETAHERKTIDWIGFMLLALGTTALQFSLDKGQEYDWLHSPLIRLFGGIALLSFIFLALWELYYHTPLIDLRLLKIPSYGFSVLIMAFSYALYFGSVVLIPLWLQQYMGYTSTWAGFAVAPIGLAPLCFSRFIAQWLKKWGSIPLLGVSFLLLALANFSTAYLNTQVDFWHVGFSRFLIGCGLLFFIIPLFTLSMQDIPTHQQPSALGFFHYVRAMLGAVGTSLFTTLWVRRSVFHHTHLAATFHPSSDWTENVSLSNQLINQQASVLAINDCSYLMGWIYIVLILLLPLARRKKNGPSIPTIHAEID